MSQQPNYRIYPSLLDKFNEYINIDATINKPWNKSKTPAEVEQGVEQSLLDSINRVPHEDSEPAEKGTAFNELIDKLVNNEISITPITLKSGKQIVSYQHTSRSGREYTFDFSLDIVNEFAEYFKGSVNQLLCTGEIETQYGVVELYGYIDELIADVVYDIKTTKQYAFGKYEHGWQKHVYPICLQQQGCNGIVGFEYTVTDFKNTYREWYDFNYDKSYRLVKEHCERFIEFLEANKERITDKKIFNQL